MININRIVIIVLLIILLYSLYKYQDTIMNITGCQNSKKKIKKFITKEKSGESKTEKQVKFDLDSDSETSKDVNIDNISQMSLNSLNSENSPYRQDSLMNSVDSVNSLLDD
jgi:hypothetical protein